MQDALETIAEQIDAGRLANQEHSEVSVLPPGAHGHRSTSEHLAPSNQTVWESPSRVTASLRIGLEEGPSLKEEFSGAPSIEIDIDPTRDGPVSDHKATKVR